MKPNPLLIPAAAALLLAACAAPKRQLPFRVSPGDPPTGKVARYDYSQYGKIPDTPTGVIYRTIQQAIPYTRKNAFRGNWAGSGRGAGRPIDAMDEIFRRHDIVYAEVRSVRTMRWSDFACIEALQRLPARTLAPEAIAYRERCAGFFTKPALNWLGKPAHCFFYRTEQRDCPFQTEADVRQLFGLETSRRAPGAVQMAGDK